jgi:choline dehydrogenase-like flavoprotein
MAKVLIIGNGGREHALAWRLAQSARVAVVLVEGVATPFESKVGGHHCSHVQSFKPQRSRRRLRYQKDCQPLPTKQLFCNGAKPTR